MKYPSFFSTLAFSALALLPAVRTASAAVDPVLLNLVMPDAKILSGMQVQETVVSPFGVYILSQMQGTNPGFEKFIAATGFDPRRDLKEVLAATAAAGPANHSGLILARGAFQPAQLLAAATAAGGAVTQYRGIGILGGEKGQGAVAFLDSSTAAMGDVPNVQAAIDRRLANATFSGDLADKAQSASATNQTWFATASPLSDFLNGKLGANMNGLSQNNLFQSVQQASGGIAFGANSVTVTADAVTSSAQNAQALVDLLKFLASMVQNRQTQTGANVTAGGEAVTTLADSATLTANGATAHLSLALSEQQAEQLFAPRIAAKAAARARQ